MTISDIVITHVEGNAPIYPSTLNTNFDNLKTGIEDRYEDADTRISSLNGTVNGSGGLSSRVDDLESSVSTLDSGVVKTTGNQTVAGNKTFSNAVYVSGVLTAPTPTAGDNSTKAATTAFVTSALGSLTRAGNGGVKFANGLIVEWATFSTTSDTYKTWNFKNSFTNSSSYAVATAKAGSTEFHNSPGVSYTSGGSCKVYINNDTARFVAVGY